MCSNQSSLSLRSSSGFPSRGDSGVGGGHYHNDDGDFVANETVQDFLDASNVDLDHAYVPCRFSPTGDFVEQGNMGGDVEGRQTASWTPGYHDSYSRHRPHGSLSCS